jgi:hypothetical protein
LDDIVSVHESDTDNKLLIITTFANKLSRKGCCCTRVQVRELKEINLLFDNYSTATLLRRSLLWNLNRGVIVDGIVIAGEDPSRDPPRRRVLVLINPFGGAGAAARNWETARAIMEKAYIELDVLFTERA